MYVARQAEGGGTGTARRQRGRRLRPYLRYARMSVEMAFAKCQHHSAQRQKKARIWEEEREVHYTPAFATTGSFSRAGALRPLRGAQLAVGAAGAAGAGTAEHCGTHRRRLALRANPRCTGAADGGPTGGIHEDARRAVTCRAGYRSAPDLFRQNPSAFFGQASSAEAGTVGGTSRSLTF